MSQINWGEFDNMELPESRKKKLKERRERKKAAEIQRRRTSSFFETRRQALKEWDELVRNLLTKVGEREWADTDFSIKVTRPKAIKWKLKHYSESYVVHLCFDRVGEFDFEPARFEILNSEGLITCPVDKESLKASILEAFRAGPRRRIKNTTAPWEYGGWK